MILQKWEGKSSWNEKSKGFTTQKALLLFYPLSIDQLLVGRKKPPWLAYEIMLLWTTIPFWWQHLCLHVLLCSSLLFHFSLFTNKNTNFERFRQLRVDCMTLRFTGKGFRSLILIEFHQKDSLMHFWYSNFTRRMSKENLLDKVKQKSEKKPR